MYIITSIIILLSGVTISPGGGPITVELSEVSGVDNGAVTYLLEIWQILQFIPTIAMIIGGLYILKKIFGLFH